MKYNIIINQFAIVKSGIDIDITDAAILDCIVGFFNSKRCASVTDEFGVYYWVSHQNIIDNLPLLNIKSKSGIKKRIEKLIAKGLLSLHPHSRDFGRSYYRIGDRFQELNFFNEDENDNSAKKNIPSPEKVDHSPLKGRDPLPEKVDDYNTNNYNTNYYKERDMCIAVKDGSPEIGISGNISQPGNKVPYDLFLKVWNENAPKGIPKVATLSKSRKEKIRNRIKEIGGVDNTIEILRQVCDKIKTTPFLLGQNNYKWKANFDFVFANDKNWIKIIEEIYGNEKDREVSKARNEREQRDRDFFEHIKAKLSTTIDDSEGEDDPLPF